MLSTSACIRKGRRRQADYPGLGVLYTRLQLPKTQRGNISVGFCLLSSYSLIDFGDALPWSFNTLSFQGGLWLFFKSSFLQEKKKRKKASTEFHHDKEKADSKRRKNRWKRKVWLKSPLVPCVWCKYLHTFLFLCNLSRGFSPSPGDWVPSLGLCSCCCSCCCCLKGL